MQILPRPSRALLVGNLVLVISLLSLVATPARGDVGVRPLLPGGSNIHPGTDAPIQMASETVVMTVRRATAADNVVVRLNPEAYGFQFQTVWFPAIAEVEADFTMANPTGEAVGLTAWFPLAAALKTPGWEGYNPEEMVPRLESFEVEVDGNPVVYTTSELPNPFGAGAPHLPWASFPVTFPAETETMIHVSYQLPLHRSAKGSELALYYIFQTGAGWSGTIGQAELIVNLPYPASAETLAGLPNRSLTPPYFFSDAGDLPPGGVLEGNQARWTWQDFEPGPQDDFSLWLLDLEKWQELESARAAVQADPQDGRTWLELASVYRSLATMGHNLPSIFGEIYLPLGLEAYQQAANLLPEHPVPHLGLGLLSLAPYMRAKNAPPEVLQSIETELQIATELEAKYPAMVEGAGISSAMLADALLIYHYNEATATADWVAMNTEDAQMTAEAGANSLPAPSATGTPAPATTPASTRTSQLQPTGTATAQVAAAEQGSGPGILISIAGLIIILVLLVLLWVGKK